MRKVSFIYIIVSLFAFYQYNLNIVCMANNSPKKWDNKNIFNDGVFIKNTGQFSKIKDKKVLYKELRDNVYFLETGIVFEVKQIRKEEKGLFKKEEEFIVKKERYAYEFVECNTDIKTELFEPKSDGYYTFQNSKELFKGYKKLVYYNVWDNIDIEFTIHEKNGIKYNIIVHPGADVSKIKFKIHSKNNPKIDSEGNLIIKTFLNQNIIDHKPISFQNNKKINTVFSLKNDLLAFFVSEYNNTQPLIIDPWVIVPSALPSNTGYDVDYDQNGNVYISSPTMQLAKYNSAGTFQWLYNGSSGSGYFSEFCTLPSGSTLWGEGFNSSGARIYKISANGILQITGGPYSTREVWTIFYNRCSGQVMGFGGGTSDMNNLQIVNDTNLTGGTIKNYNGYTGSCCNDVVDAVIDVNGDFFAVQVTGTGPEKLQKCAGPAYNPPLLFDVLPGYGYEECNCFTFPAIPLSTNRANVLALNSSYLYTFGGRTIKVWNKNTGALIASQVVNASYVDGVSRTCDGIAVDECNNIYVGGMNTIHAYHFDGSSFSALPNIATPGAVYDLALDEKNGILYAVGNGFLGSYNVPTNISFSLSMVPVSCGACNGIINIANTSTCTSTGFIFNINPGNITTTNTAVPNLCAQLYTVAANLGCKGKIWEDTITVASNTSGITVTFNVSNPSCNGGTGSATVMPYNASYGYTWQPSVSSGTLATGLSPGIYTVNVSNGGSCTGSGTFQITQPPALSIAVSATSISCNGLNNGSASATVTGGNGGYTYTWLPVGGNSSATSNLPPGIYTLSVLDASNCPISSTLQIQEPPALSISVNVQSITCSAPGSATANVSGGTGGYTYTWLPSGGNSNIATGLSAGNYSVNIQDANGCSISYTFSITGSPPLIINSIATNSVSCYGGNNGSSTVSVSGGNLPYSYSYSPASGTNSITTGLTSGNYTVYVTDANSCTTSSVFVIQQPPALSLTATQTQSISCNGGNNGSAAAIPSGGVGGYSYTWSPSGGNSTNATNLTAGIYTVNVTDANNCSISQTVQITQPPALSLTANQTQSVSCNGGNNGIATATASGGVGGYTYIWIPSGGNAASANNLSAGIYTITISDANACGPLSATVQIDQPPALSITANSQSVTCFGYADGSASVNVTGGVGGYSYTWTPSGGNSNTATGLTAGIYTISVTDANACPIFTTINIPQPSSVSLVASPNQTICYGTSANILANASGGNPPYSYNWSNALPNAPGPHLVSPTITTIYTVQAIDANNCPSPILNTKITVLPPLLATGMSTTICDGQSAFIYPTITSPGNGGPYSYLWSNAMSNPSVTVIGNYLLGSQNIYTVIISDGCSMPDAVAQITVNINPNPVISFSAIPQKGCVPLTVQYSATSDGSNDSFQWFFGNNESSNSAQSVTTYTQSGLFTPTLTVTNIYGCSSTSIAPNYIEVYPKPIADFIPNTWTVNILEPTVQFINQSVGAISYTWNFGDYSNPNNVSYLTNPVHEYLYSGTYTVMLVAVNSQGCFDNIAKVLYVEPEFHLYIPNVFTPDGNGLNDVFQPKGIGIDESDYKMLIFDRWGELIFQSNDFKKGWDGSVKGNAGKATQDVYVYKIYVRDLKGNKHEFVGHVTCLPYTKE